MRVDQATRSVTPISKEALLQKMDKLAQDFSRLNQYPMSLFKSHVEEVRKAVAARLLDSDLASDPILKDQYYLFSWLYVLLLSEQVEKFNLVEASTGNPVWAQLNMVVDDLASRLELCSKPLPFFGGSFYCTGSLTYVESGIPVSPFYQVSTESHESVLFWPLLAHEIAHLKLCETDDVRNLRRELVRGNLRNEKYQERLDEALCDAMATLLYGPAYVASFGTKFWQISDEYHDEGYPSNQFRLFIMFKIAQEQDTESSISSLRDNFEVSERLAKKEKISFLTDEMIELAQRLVRNPTDVNESRINGFSSDLEKIGTGKLDYLFNVLWSMIYRGAKTFGAATNDANRLLERWAKRS